MLAVPVMGGPAKVTEQARVLGETSGQLIGDDKAVQEHPLVRPRVGVVIPELDQALLEIAEAKPRGETNEQVEVVAAV